MSAPHPSHQGVFTLFVLQLQQRKKRKKERGLGQLQGKYSNCYRCIELFPLSPLGRLPGSPTNRTRIRPDGQLGVAALQEGQFRIGLPQVEVRGGEDQHGRFGEGAVRGIGGGDDRRHVGLVLELHQLAMRLAKPTLHLRRITRAGPVRKNKQQPTTPRVIRVIRVIRVVRVIRVIRVVRVTHPPTPTHPHKSFPLCFVPCYGGWDGAGHELQGLLGGGASKPAGRAGAGLGASSSSPQPRR